MEQPVEKNIESKPELPKNIKGWMYMALATSLVVGGIYLYLRSRPKIEIKRYNKNPGIKKPRKWRGILRRRAAKKSKNISHLSQRICKDCKTEIFADFNMVMVKDSIWEKICDNFSDEICDKCMEKRLGREIVEEDFKEPSFSDQKIIPCNAWWLAERKKQSKPDL